MRSAEDGDTLSIEIQFIVQDGDDGILNRRAQRLKDYEAHSVLPAHPQRPCLRSARPAIAQSHRRIPTSRDSSPRGLHNRS
jgi:hypothetical protein